MIDVSDYSNVTRVIELFEEISLIPRGSGNTRAIADYLENFAKERSLEVWRDAADNVIIRKKATKGYEARPAVILQGHTDIVAEKTLDCKIDMATEGLELYRDGDFIRARGTTLGGDDGVAVAYALALLDSNEIEHPTLECVFTSDEEIGLIGAEALDTTPLTGKTMINIDSDDEGVFTVGCAGGVRADISLPVKRESFDGKCYNIELYGYMGGHSGVEIDKGRENAIKSLGEMLSMIGDIRLVSFKGGNADNAIPRDASATIVVNGAFNRMGFDAIFDRYKEREAGAEYRITECECKTLPLDRESTEGVLALLDREPTGVIAMNPDIEGLVETSLNMGIARLEESAFELSFSIRSGRGEAKEKLVELVKIIATRLGAAFDTRGGYPAWEYKRESHLRDVMCEVYERMYGKSPIVMTIHAGLECGIFSDKIAGLDCVSMGPDNYDIHTPEEHLSISSTARVWEYLLEVLKVI